MKLFYEKYIKLAHIGKGANAHVYKVRHAELGYVRAIKVLNDYIESKSERIYQSFLKECKTLLAIGNGAHPNIIRIYGPDLIDNHAIVEMDYVQGTTLDSYIKEKGFLDFEEVKTFIHDIVGALAYTHHNIYSFLMDPNEDDLQLDSNDGQKFLITPEKEAELVKKYGIAHNDLHSNNVMRRDYDGSFVLLDFGLAVQDGKCVKSSRMGDGNPEYQAPEKFDSDTVDPRSDVYSLGVLMYEMLAGRVPFVLEYDNDGKVSQRAINNVLNQHISSTPPPILPFRKAAYEKQNPSAVYERDYPEGLDGVIMKCLAKNPQKRYENAKALLNDLNHFLKDASFEKEIEDLNKEIVYLRELCSSERKEKEKFSAETDLLKVEQNILSQKYDAIVAENRALNNRIDTIIKAQSNDYADIQEELSRLKSEKSKLLDQWKYEKDAKERIMASSAKQDIEYSKELHQLKQDIEQLSAQWTYEKNENQNLQTRIQEIETNGVTPIKKSHKQWKFAFIVSLLAIIGVGIWGYRMMLDFEGVKWRYESLREDLKQKELPSALTGEIITPDESVTSSPTDVGSENVKSNQPTITNSVIEYRTPPEIQKELNQLKSENNRLRGQVERLLNNMSNYHGIDER